MSKPDDLILNAADDAAIRQGLVEVALGRRAPPRAIAGGGRLSVH